MIVLITIWLIFAVITHGFSFAHFQRRWPRIAKEQYSDQLVFSLFDSVGGPIALLAFALSARGHAFKYGFKLW